MRLGTHAHRFILCSHSSGQFAGIGVEILSYRSVMKFCRLHRCYYIRYTTDWLAQFISMILCSYWLIYSSKEVGDVPMYMLYMQGLVDDCID
jgi:hypothetical protein